MTNYLTCFYTEKTPYEKEAEIFLNNARVHWKGHLVSRRVPSEGSWVRNCALKPGHISRVLDMLLPGDTLLYLDVDARFLRECPELPDVPVFGARLYKGKIDSATLIFRKCQEAELILGKWLGLCKVNPDIWDQKHLDTVIEDLSKPEWFTELDKKWCFIDKLDGDFTSNDTIIYQTQASRRLKKQIK